MPQLRQNMILKDWVIISTERAKRPEQLKEDKNINEQKHPEFDENCPFCPGNEEKSQNTTVLYSIGDPIKWELKVIPNKFPALMPTDDGLKMDTDTYFRWMEGIGHHEVIIESPIHNTTIATMPIDNVEKILKTYRQRLKYLLGIPYIETVITFRNHGTRAGASLIHPHSQVIALPVTPRDVMYRVNESIRYYEEHRKCIFCSILESEIKSGERMIVDSEHFAAFVPYAASSPFQMWIYPKRHAASFTNITDDEIADMAMVLQKCLRKLYFGLNDPDYNYIIRSAPKGYGDTPSFHWYLTIVPRLTRSAGFELGSGTFINPTIPEQNAEYLRSIEV